MLPRTCLPSSAHRGRSGGETPCGRWRRASGLPQGRAPGSSAFPARLKVPADTAARPRGRLPASSSPPAPTVAPCRRAAPSVLRMDMKPCRPEAPIPAHLFQASAPGRTWKARRHLVCRQAPPKKRRPEAKVRVIFLLLQCIHQCIPPAFPDWSCQSCFPFVQCFFSGIKRSPLFRLLLG